MKRLVAILFFLALNIIIAALVIPSFIDWSDHKEQIENRIEAYLQRDIDIKGNVSFHILPQPAIIIEDVSISNIKELSTEKFINFKKIAGSLKLGPLLEGKIVVDSAELTDPIVNLTIVENGSANWLNIFEEKPKKALGGAAGAIKLNKVNFMNATVNYNNFTNGSKFSVNGLNMFVTADTLLGPYEILGNMSYKDTGFNFDIKTKKYNASGALPLNASFRPYKNKQGRPDIKFNGIVDFKKRFDAQGEFSLENGSIASMVESLKSIEFLNKKSSFKSILDIKGNDLSFKDLKATIGDDGVLNGEISAKFSNNNRAFFDFNLEGKNLVLSDQPVQGYIDVPTNFSGKIRFKGKNLLLNNKKIALVDSIINFDNNQWQFKYTNMLLNDGTNVTLYGEALPLQKSAYYDIKFSTNDFTKFIGILESDNNNIIKSLSESGLIDTMDFSGKVAVSPKGISFYNFDSQINKTKMKLSGVVNVNNKNSKSNFEANVNLFDWDTTTFSKEAKAKFLKAVIKSDANIELVSKNLKGSDITLKDVTFNAHINNGKLDIRTFKGGVSEKEKFYITGNIASLDPVSDVDISYTMDSIKPSSIAQLFGIDMPPMFFSWKDSNIVGTIKGDAKKYTFMLNSNVRGGDILLQGSKGADEYNIDLSIKNKKNADILEYMGLPVYSIFSDKGEFNFKGQLTGTEQNYRINNIIAKQGKGGFKGYIEKKKDIYSGSIEVSAFDVDKFILHKFNSKLNSNLNLKGKTLWGGEMNSNIAFNKKTGMANFKGTIKDIELEKLKDKIGFKEGFSLNKGDINFDLISQKNKLTGNIDIKTSLLTIKDLNFSTLGKAIDELTSVPSSTSSFIKKQLQRSGNSIFTNVSANLSIDGAAYTIRSLKLSNLDGDITVKGSGNIKNNSYSIKSKLELKEPRRVPPFDILRSSGNKEYTIDASSIEKFIVINNPPPLAVQSNIAPLPDAATALPPVTEYHTPNEVAEDVNTPVSGLSAEELSHEVIPEKKSSNKAIGDILKSLED